jgi:uncharacterized membrane protein YeaQ/YmgE (transglycosylase-associated protein family)
VYCCNSDKINERLAWGETNHWEAYSMDMTSIITQLVIGAIGGNGAGALMKDKSLGTVGNTIAGVIGGLGGGQILGKLLNSGAVDAAGAAVQGGGLVESIAGGGIGGAVLMIVVGMIKNMMNKPA